jgi:prophage regulatory protein
MRVLPYEDLKAKKGIPYSRFYLRQLIAKGQFPRPVKLGGNRVAFVEDEIDAWLRERAAERTDSAA